MVGNGYLETVDWSTINLIRVNGIDTEFTLIKDASMSRKANVSLKLGTRLFQTECYMAE